MSSTTLLAVTLFVNLTIVFIGVLAFLHNRRSATNILFLLISIITAFWSFANFFSIQEPSQNTLFWIRLVLFFAAPHAVLFFLFIHTFPATKLKLNRRILALIGLILIITMGSTLSPYVFSAVKMQGAQVIPIPGPLMFLFALITLGSIAGGIFMATWKYLHSSTLEKIQWRFLLFGTSLSYLSLIVTNFLSVVVWSNTAFNALGALYMLPMIIGTAYAILQHHLLSVKVIATEILIFIVTLVSFLGIWTYQDTNDLIFRIGIFLGFLIGGVFLIRSVLKEVEQRERLESLTKKLELANEELKRLDKAKSEFVSITSHQLRTPLTATKGYISLVLEGTYGAIEEKFKKPLQKVYYSNERLIHLVNDLLSFSRIESGKMQLEREPVDIAEIVQSVIAELQIKAEEKELKLVLKKSTSAPSRAQLDKEKIRNVVLNLIDNAIRYTKEGSITTSITQENDTILLSVQDTGEGMTQEEIAKLFESFSRGQAGAKFSIEGAGLGLYIAKQFVEMHKGKIWAESPGKGKGSTFYVELPMK